MDTLKLPRRSSTRLGIDLGVIAFGAFKIGRNTQTKYAQPYALPSDAEVERLLDQVRACGANLIDTAPAYGSSETRLGALLQPSGGMLISTKVGERFEHDTSSYDFSPRAVRLSVQESLTRLRRTKLDLVCVHSDGSDRRILERDGTIGTLRELQAEGLISRIGFSGKTVEGNRLALMSGAVDALIVEFHPLDDSHRSVIREAHERGVAILVKKPLASGRVPPKEAIPFCLAEPGVTTLVIGTLSRENFAENCRLAVEFEQNRSEPNSTI